jgi:hypothetical protein
MPGLGRRTFAPGEVLTATNVMGYLQDQAVMTFAGTAARGSAIGTAVSEGMVSYLADTDAVEVYTTSWQNILFSETSFGTSGYYRFRNGIIIQWGRTPNVSGGTNTTFTFPITFPNEVFSATGTVSAGASFTGKGVSIDSLSTSNVVMSHGIGATTNIYVIAIGR